MVGTVVLATVELVDVDVDVVELRVADAGDDEPVSAAMGDAARVAALGPPLEHAGRTRPTAATTSTDHRLAPLTGSVSRAPQWGIRSGPWLR